MHGRMGAGPNGFPGVRAGGVRHVPGGHGGPRVIDPALLVHHLVLIDRHGGHQDPGVCGLCHEAAELAAVIAALIASRAVVPPGAGGQGAEG